MTVQGKLPRPEAEDIIAADIAEAIGRFVVAWGTIEHELEAIITTMFRVAPVQRPALSADFVLRSKIDLIKTGIALNDIYIEKDNSKSYFKLLGRLMGLNGEVRNFVYHWTVHVAPDDAVVAGKIMGGHKPKLKFIRPSKKYFDDLISQIKSIRFEVRQMREELTTAFNEFEAGYAAAKAFNAKRALLDLDVEEFPKQAE